MRVMRMFSPNGARLLSTPGIDYDETSSLVMDVITFHYLISLVVSKKLNMQLMNVVIAYLFGDLNTEIYMKVPEGLKLPESSSS